MRRELVVAWEWTAGVEGQERHRTTTASKAHARRCLERRRVAQMMDSIDAAGRVPGTERCPRGERI
eukprot:1630024-Pleurochrysis_carterae.AAC.6